MWKCENEANSGDGIHKSFSAEYFDCPTGHYCPEKLIEIDSNRLK